jgi:hypothetical protein
MERARARPLRSRGSIQSLRAVAALLVRAADGAPDDPLIMHYRVYVAYREAILLPHKSAEAAGMLLSHAQELRWKGAMRHAAGTSPQRGRPGAA